MCAPTARARRRALAFLGDCVAADGRPLTELFLVDLPDDVTRPGNGPLEGTPTRRPAPPAGVHQRRLAHTAGRPFPGIQGPRHWPRSAPDGSQIAILMRDDAGIVQLWTISPTGGAPRQITNDPYDVTSAFTWSPSGELLAYIADSSVHIVEVATGKSQRLTAPAPPPSAPRPEACVFSPNGQRIAFVRPVCTGSQTWNQIFVVHANQ